MLSHGEGEGPSCYALQDTLVSNSLCENIEFHFQGTNNTFSLENLLQSNQIQGSPREAEFYNKTEQEKIQTKSVSKKSWFIGFQTMAPKYSLCMVGMEGLANSTES